MIKPRYNPFFIWFFNHYTRINVEHHFSKVNLVGTFNDEGRPVLMIGNHFSWWDGFFAHYLNMKLLNRRFNVMMLESELRQRMFLNKIGAFSIHKGARSAIESINFLKELLRNRKNLVVYYPQGSFQSLYEPNLLFESGIAKILKGFKASDLQLFFYTALVDYLAEKKPMLTFHLSEYKLENGITASDIEKAFNQFYRSAIKNQIASV